jgi:hypothetical protein
MVNINNLTAPGIYLFEETAGVPPTEIAPFNRCYMIGSATGSVTPIHTPTLVRSSEDFINQFGGSVAVNRATLDVFFSNVSQLEGQLYYSKLGIAPRAIVSVDTLSASGVYSLNINGTPLSFTADASPTNAEVINGLATAINSANGLGVTATPALDDAGADYSGGLLIVYQNDPTATPFTITETDAKLSIATAVGVPTSPQWWDYVRAIQQSFDGDMPLGFIICPEAFASLVFRAERLRVANALESVAATLDWVGLADCGAMIDTVAELDTEAAAYISPLGHLAYYAPWLRDSANRMVSAAICAAIVFFKRSAREGFQEPPAGTRHPIRGIVESDMRITASDQAALNPDGVNCIRFFPRVGWVVYGARSRSSNPLYRFINTRIILSIYNRTLIESLEAANVAFSASDGIGQLFGRITEIANSVGYRFWRSRAFFGETSQLAFLNVCDRSNNSASDLESGIVQLDSYVSPSPTAERILARTIRIPIAGGN